VKNHISNNVGITLIIVSSHQFAFAIARGSAGNELEKGGSGAVLPPMPYHVRTVGPVLGVNEWLPSCTVRTPETVGLDNSPDTLSQVLGGGPFTFSRGDQPTPQLRIVKRLELHSASRFLSARHK